MGGMEDYQHFYLSPHLDDVVLSCGGAIHRQARGGEKVLIATLFAGRPDYAFLSPFAAQMHALSGAPPDLVALRRAEDEAAARLLGAQPIHFDYLDCIYRRHGSAFLYTSEQDIFGAVHPADEGLKVQLASHLAGIKAEQPEATIYVPLAVGHHVDHQLVRRAALALDISKLVFYEDYPYIEREGALATAQAEFGEVRWSAQVQEIDIEAKIEAIASYASQTPSLFGDAKEMARRVRTYAASIDPERGHCERCWIVS